MTVMQPTPPKHRTRFGRFARRRPNAAAHADQAGSELTPAPVVVWGHWLDPGEGGRPSRYWR